MKSVRTKALLWSAAGLGTLLAVRAVARSAGRSVFRVRSYWLPAARVGWAWCFAGNWPARVRGWPSAREPDELERASAELAEHGCGGHGRTVRRDRSAAG